MRIHLTLKSTNQKTGPIPVSTTSKETCPKICPWIDSGCYANLGPLGLHWRKVTEGDRGDNWKEFLGKIKELPEDQLWRHNQAGDLPGKGIRINRVQLSALTAASLHTRGFTYTHKPVEGKGITAKRNRAAIKEANSKGFTINLSANSLKHADKLQKLGIAPVTTIVDSEETRATFLSPDGNTVTVCPAARRDVYDHEGKTAAIQITCKECVLCAIPTRKTIIAFPAHGTMKKKVNAKLQVLN